jgi:hypothetical protein
MRSAMRRGSIELPSPLVFCPSSSAPEKMEVGVGVGVLNGVRLGVGEGEGDGEGERAGSVRAESSDEVAGWLTVRLVL